MPILNNERSFKKIILPSSLPDDEAYVEVWDKVLTSDVVGLSEYQDNKNRAAVEMLVNIIKDWNFTDKDGVKLPVTAENVNFLDIRDFAFIIEKTAAFKEIAEMSTVKKNN